MAKSVLILDGTQRRQGTEILHETSDFRALRAISLRVLCGEVSVVKAVQKCSTLSRRVAKDEVSKRKAAIQSLRALCAISLRILCGKVSVVKAVLKCSTPSRRVAKDKSG